MTFNEQNFRELCRYVRANAPNLDMIPLLQSLLVEIRRKLDQPNPDHSHAPISNPDIHTYMHEINKLLTPNMNPPFSPVTIINAELFPQAPAP